MYYLGFFGLQLRYWFGTWQSTNTFVLCQVQKHWEFAHNKFITNNILWNAVVHYLIPSLSVQSSFHLLLQYLASPVLQKKSPKVPVKLLKALPYNYLPTYKYCCSPCPCWQNTFWQTTKTSFTTIFGGSRVWLFSVHKKPPFLLLFRGNENFAV